MLQELALPGTYFWSVWLDRAGVSGNSFLLGTPQGMVAVDPLPLDDAAHERVEELGVAFVCCTVPERRETASAFAQRYGATMISDLRDGAFVIPGVKAIALNEQRRADTWALLFTELDATFAGDALLGVPAGALSMHPASEYDDIRGAALELRRLLARDPKVLLTAYGQPIVENAYDKLYRLLYAHAGPAVHRINVDELEFRELRDPEDPRAYDCTDAEVGFIIGARGLGYRVTTLPPGKRFCPLHTHAREEELLFVLDGEPSVRGETETIRCRRGDFVAFPAGDTGTHQVLNESDAPATFMLLARTEFPEVCRYPDSHKLLVDLDVTVGRRSYMIAHGPQLEYYHGEEIR